MSSFRTSDSLYFLFPVPVSPSPVHILYGHDAAVNAVACCASLDIVASASDDGTVILHSLHKGTYLRSLYIDKGEGGRSGSYGESRSPPRVEWVDITSCGNIVTYRYTRVQYCEKNHGTGNWIN